ncbi:MAG: lysophospholipid acyltransferase family protein [Flavobacteriaceae bacterium]|nr:lysophospholipid acyltransferase family protein [Flavobacteriaceae bacterium]
MKGFFYYLYYPPLYLISTFPDWTLYLVSHISYFLVYRLFGYRRKIVRKNLDTVFPDLRDDEKKKLEKASYKNFCDVLLESIRPLGQSVESVNKRIEYRNPDLMKELQNNHELMILLSGHYAAWELIPTVSKFSRWPIYPLYAPIRNSSMAQIVHKIRSKFDCELVSRYAFAKHIISRQKDKLGGVYVFINDQSPRSENRGLMTHFLNQWVPVHNGAERISRMMNIPVVYLAVTRTRRGFYQAEFKLITDRPNQLPKGQITKTFVTFLEQQIYSDPTQYLWTHNRFKHQANQSIS